MPQDGYWLANFEIIPPLKSWLFHGQKNRILAHAYCHECKSKCLVLLR